MEHQMRLNPEHFEAIKAGKKKHEIRLNDEKREKINVGDIIVFSKRPECKENIKVRVVSRTEHAEYQNLPPYYSRDEMKKYGIVVFGIELFKPE
ncbi:DUF3850 domain-containing protein [Candidatus Pacearchaeota archaeon]|nr:DUF3850 domain-containing protein [Candidatus Pacearchaeota archaeon]